MVVEGNKIGHIQCIEAQIFTKLLHVIKNFMTLCLSPLSNLHIGLRLLTKRLLHY